MFGVPWITLVDSCTWAAFSLSCNQSPGVTYSSVFLSKIVKPIPVGFVFFCSSTSYLECSLYYYCWYCCCLEVKVLRTIQKKPDWLKLSVWCQDYTRFGGLLMTLTGFCVDTDGVFGALRLFQMTLVLFVRGHLEEYTINRSSLRCNVM